MNARTIKNQIKKAGMNHQEFEIIKMSRQYAVHLKNSGISDIVRMKMTGDQVNAIQAEQMSKLDKVAEAINGTHKPMLYHAVVEIK